VAVLVSARQGAAAKNASTLASSRVRRIGGRLRQILRPSIERSARFREQNRTEIGPSALVL